MGKDYIKLRKAIVEGISKGWTAKETAYNFHFTVDEVRHEAYRMKVAFPWTRIGVPPRFCKQPVPLSTLFQRHRHTSEHAAVRIQKVVRRMDKSSKEAEDLLKIAGFLRQRSIPEAWEKRIKVTK